MSLWSYPEIKECDARIQASKFYQDGEQNPYALWQGLRAMHLDMIKQKGALMGLMYHSPDARKDKKQIDALKGLEIKSEFLGAIFYLTHHDDEVRRRAEKRVWRVIQGELPVNQGATVSTQFRRMLDDSEIRMKERVSVSSPHSSLD
jgi:hypothetical protein